MVLVLIRVLFSKSALSIGGTTFSPPFKTFARAHYVATPTARAEAIARAAACHIAVYFKTFFNILLLSVFLSILGTVDLDQTQGLQLPVQQGTLYLLLPLSLTSSFSDQLLATFSFGTFETPPTLEAHVQCSVTLQLLSILSV